MVLFRIGALVVWRGQVVPIINREVLPDAALYLIHTRSPKHGLVIDVNVTFGQLVSEINHYARYCVGDTLSFGAYDVTIKARWWSCRQGTVVYRLGHAHDPRRSARYTQEVLVQRVEGVMENSA